MARTSFKFRLRRLLDVRLLREKQAQQELVARRSQLAMEEQKLREVQAAELQLREEQARPLERGGDLHDFAMRRQFLEHAIKENVEQQVAQQGRIQQAEQRVAEQVDVLKQRGIEVKALEKLEEKQREEHRLEQLREQGIFLDDLASQGFLRRRTERARIEHEEQAT